MTKYINIDKISVNLDCFTAIVFYLFMSTAEYERPLADELILVEPLTKEDFFGELKQRLRNKLYPVGEAYLHSWQKRTFDVVGSILLMPLAGTAIVGSAVLVKLEDGGPVFVTLDVPGENQEHFGMIKIRSMTDEDHNKHKNGRDHLFHEQEKMKITRVGKILRRWSVDELPQLLNILKGDLSLVGNRPMFEAKITALGEVDKVSDLYPKWREKAVVAKPGCAGLATARGRKLLDQDENGLRRRMRYETFYVEHASVGFDLKLLGETIKAALTRHGSF